VNLIVLDITYIWWIRIVDLFTFSHGRNRNKQGGRVTLMWLAAPSSGLVVFWCGHMVLWRNPLGLKKKKKETETVDNAYW